MKLYIDSWICYYYKSLRVWFLSVSYRLNSKQKFFIFQKSTNRKRPKKRPRLL